MKCTSLVLAVLTGCSFSSKLTTGGTSPGGGATSTPMERRGADSVGTAAMPDLKGLTPEQALAALHRAGFETKTLDFDDQLCSYDSGEKNVPKGTVCEQRPYPGQVNSVRVRVEVLIEEETFTHGGQGLSEWRRVPDINGKPLAAAKALFAREGFDIAKHLQILDGDCATGTICSSSPRAGERANLSRGVRLYVGVAAPPPPPPTAPPAQPTPPPAEGDKGYF